jgi:hypothetical protein
LRRRTFAVNGWGTSTDERAMTPPRVKYTFECFFCHKDMESPEGTRCVPGASVDGKTLKQICYCCRDCQKKLDEGA